MATPNNGLVIQTYGNTGEIASLSKRIKIMVPGGNKLSDSEAQALAQISLVTKCNPFIGEIWYIPGRGPMIGIKGARRHGNEQIEEAGGKDAYWVPDLQVCSAEEAGAGDVKDVAAAYRCIITDSVSTGKFQKMFVDAVNTFRAAGSPDPVGEAREILGKRPQWVGYGYSTVSEQSKMNKQALAMKRAEAAALKQKFDIPFGTEVAAGDNATETGAIDWIDAGVATSEQVENEFPQENVNQETGKEQLPIEMVKPLDGKAVKFAAREWNISDAEAAKEIAKLKLGNLIEWGEFVQIVREGRKAPRSREQNIRELTGE